MTLQAAFSLSFLIGALGSFPSGMTPVAHQKLIHFMTCPLFDLVESTPANQYPPTGSQSLHAQSGTANSDIPSQDPWTINPTCWEDTTSEFCVFTSTTFNNNRGISVLTKPSIARTMARSPAFNPPEPDYPSKKTQLDPPFKVVSLPGKGMGMIANRTIQVGELIKGHPAIAVLHNDAVDRSLSHFTHTAPLMQLAITQLPAETHALFLAMAAHNISAEPYSERIYTNTFGEDFASEEHSIIVPETARMNHDCRPNAIYYFDRKTLWHYTHATRMIQAGEEITITYIDPLQTRSQRRRAIMRSWGFECDCALCNSPPQFRSESNRRIQLINDLLALFSNTGKRSGKVTGSLEMAETLISLYEQERLYAAVADGYRLAALSAAAVGRRWDVLKWGMRGVEMGLVMEGPEDRDVRDLMDLVEDVEGHWSWGVNLGVDGEVIGGEEDVDIE